MRIAFVIPGELDQPTGGYQYDRHIVSCWRIKGIDAEVISLPGEYPLPSEPDRQSGIRVAQKIGGFDHMVIDGLAGGGSPLLMEQFASKAPLTALIHHPLCLENGIGSQEQQRLERTESEGLAFVHGIVTTSTTTASTVAELFGFDPGRIKTVEPGVARGKIAEPWESGPVRLMCVGSLIERKGHTYLIDALAKLEKPDWQLDCYGSDTYDLDLANKLRRQVSHHGLQDRISFHGSTSTEVLEHAYANAHAFVLPSLYEGYGMVLAEAIVRGLPVISTTAGAIPQTVPKGCGILVEPANSDALATALHNVIEDHALRNKFRDNTLATASSFPDWEQSAEIFLTCLGEFS